jgi:hypothetical protein
MGMLIYFSSSHLLEPAASGQNGGSITAQLGLV